MSFRRTSFLAVASFLTLLISVLPAVAVDTFYKADFKGWRDNRTNAGFNGIFDRLETGGVVSLAEGADFGKVMTPEKPITMDITNTLMLQVELSNVSDGTSVDIEIMEANPPYGGQRVLAGLTQAGTYAASMGKGTGWKGVKSFWVAVWVGGPGATAQVNQIRIGENIAEEKTTAEPSGSTGTAAVRTATTALPDEMKKKRLDLKADKSKQYGYFEEWKNGLDGWRDESVQTGFHSNAQLQTGGGILLQPKDRAPQSKFVSSIKPVTVDFAKYPYFELVLDGEAKGGWAYVRLVQATNPDNFRTVIESLNQPGVYVANVPDQASWNAEQSFYVEIVLEGPDLKVPIASVGFCNKLSTVTSLMPTLLQTTRNLEVAPSKKADVLRVNVVADNFFRGGWYGGAATSPSWDQVDRYGKLLSYVGASELDQKLYLITSINPADKVEMYAAIGYDLQNNANGLNWENLNSRNIPAKIDYGLVRYQDLYIGNVAQIGSVYDPLFTDMTLKKVSTTRGALWKPALGDLRFKFFGTRNDVSISDYKHSIYTLGGRVTRDFTSDLGTVQLGASAVNMAKTNSELDPHLFQGRVDAGQEKSFSPSVYLRVDNNTNTTLYYQPGLDTYVYVSLTTKTGPEVVYADLGTAAGNAYVFTLNNAALNGSAVTITKGGYIIYKIPLVVNGVPLDDPGPSITEIGIHYAVGGWTQSYYTGSLSVSVGTNSLETPPVANSTPVGPDPNHLATYDAILDSGQLAKIKAGTFDAAEGTLARSLLGVDLRGQLLGFNLNGEYVASLAHNETYYGDRTTRRTDGYYLNFSRGVSGILFKGAWFNMPPTFSTALDQLNTVDDNDNHGYSADNDPGKAGVIFGDFYNQGVPNVEYVNGLYVPQDYLYHERDDQNHNGILDDRENDHQPDYPYHPDQRGYKLSAVIPRQVLEGLFLSNTEITVSGEYVNRISSPGYNQATSLDVLYKNTDYDNVIFQIGAYATRIHDVLSNQIALYDADDTSIKLVNAYPDNLVVTPEVMLQVEMPRGPRLILLDRYRYDRQFSDYGTALLGRRQGNMAVADLRYKQYLVDTLAVEPVYVGRFGAVQANTNAPIHNSYYIPVETDASVNSNTLDIPINHSFYLKSSFVVRKEYQVALDVGLELSMFAKKGLPDSIIDRLAVGILRDLPGGYVRVHYELSKAYYPYDTTPNWSQGALWAQVTLNF